MNIRVPVNRNEKSSDRSREIKRRFSSLATHSAWHSNWYTLRSANYHFQQIHNRGIVQLQRSVDSEYDDRGFMYRIIKIHRRGINV